MWYIVIGIIVLGVVAAIAGYFRNRKWQKMLERGEISEIPEAQELVTDECCGQHETCERDSLLAASAKKSSIMTMKNWTVFGESRPMHTMKMP